MLLLLRFFNVLYVFFENSNNSDFLRFFALLHTFSRTMVWGQASLEAASYFKMHGQNCDILCNLRRHMTVLKYHGTFLMVVCVSIVTHTTTVMVSKCNTVSYTCN